MRLQQRQPIRTQDRVVRIDHHGVEEVIDRLAQGRELLQRRGVVARCEHRLDLARNRHDLLGQHLFRGIDELRLVDRLADGFRHLLQDVGDALVGRREARRVRQLQELHQCAQPGIEIERRRRASRQHGVERFDRNSDVGGSFDVVRTQAFDHVVVHLDRKSFGVDRRQRLALLGRDTRHVGSRGGDGLADQSLQVEVEPALDRRAQQAERGTAQAERIARAGGFLPRRVDARDGVELVGDRERHARAR